MLPIQFKPINHNFTANANNPIYIVVHDTGNYASSANALAHCNFFSGGNRNASAHYFVDTGNIIQIIKDKDSAWHVGDGNNKYGISNKNSIGIEMCVNDMGKYNIVKSNTIELIRYLMQKYNIPISRVVRHYDASRKNCPGSLSANNWAAWWQFIEDIKYNNIQKEEVEMTNEEVKQLIRSEVAKEVNSKVYSTDPTVPVWGETSMNSMLEKGIFTAIEENAKPNSNMTRAELAVAFDRLINYVVNAILNNPDETVADWFKADIEKAKEIGLLKGEKLDNGKIVYEPKSATTKEEVVAIVMRGLGLVKG